MNVGISGIKILIRQMDYADLRHLCKKYLNIDYDKMIRTNECHRLKFEYMTNNTKPGVIIETSTEIDTKDCDVMLELNKVFFDNAPAGVFDLGKLIRFISRFRYSIKQLDIAFNDDEKCLSVGDIQHWCKNSGDYCIGSLVKWNTPGLVIRNGILRRIRLESTASKTNYGIINIARNTGRISLVLKIRKKEKILYILENYGNYLHQSEEFERRCRSLLVSCVDFITAQSKKNRVKSRYKRQASWSSFLGQEVEILNWSRIYNDKK